MVRVGTCCFIKSWAGICKKQTTIVHDGRFYCAKHAKMVCHVCDKQATHDCPETMGASVCGTRMCDQHGHSHGLSYFM